MLLGQWSWPLEKSHQRAEAVFELPGTGANVAKFYLEDRVRIAAGRFHGAGYSHSSLGSTWYTTEGNCTMMRCYDAIDPSSTDHPHGEGFSSLHFSLSAEVSSTARADTGSNTGP